ncbi:MAG: ribose-phosphate diphosphokinase [Flavisolibacter sp.]
MKLFALNSSRNFGEAVAAELKLALSLHEERNFEDGEHKTRPLENVRNKDVYVIHSLYSDGAESVNDKLCRLLFFIGTLKDAGASRVTAVVPYMCYGRKDRRTKPRDPVTTRYVAQMFEASGADCVLTIDVHNLQAFQNAFRKPAINLDARKIFAQHLSPLISTKEISVMSPDFGGVKRAELFLETFSKASGKDVSLAVMEKFRSSGTVWGEKIAGDVKNKTVIVLDDLISTGGTMARAAEACKHAGAERVIALATHGLFTGTAASMLINEVLDQIVVTNTVPPFRLAERKVNEKLTVLNAAPLFAAAIRCLHEGCSIVDLLEN